MTANAKTPGFCKALFTEKKAAVFCVEWKIHRCEFLERLCSDLSQSRIPNLKENCPRYWPIIYLGTKWPKILLSCDLLTFLYMGVRWGGGEGGINKPPKGRMESSIIPQETETHQTVSQKLGRPPQRIRTNQNWTKSYNPAQSLIELDQFLILSARLEKRGNPCFKQRTGEPAPCERYRPLSSYTSIDLFQYACWFIQPDLNCPGTPLELADLGQGG